MQQLLPIETAVDMAWKDELTNCQMRSQACECGAIHVVNKTCGRQMQWGCSNDKDSSFKIQEFYWCNNYRNMFNQYTYKQIKHKGKKYIHTRHATQTYIQNYFVEPYGGISASVVGSQQGLRCGSICPVTTGQESVVNPCATSPHSVQISHPHRQGPSSQETCQTILSNARSCRYVVFRGAEDLPGTKDPVAACLLSMRLTVAGVKPTRAAIAPCLMPSRASANTSCLIPIGVGRGIGQTIRKTFEKICKYWFKVVTVWRLIWGNDHLYCGLGARRSHLTLHWMSAQGSVGFRWGTITVHIMPILAKWKNKSSIHISFIVFNGGVTTLFAKSVWLKLNIGCFRWHCLQYTFKVLKPVFGTNVLSIILTGWNNLL